MQEMWETVAHILRGGLGAFQPSVAGVVRDVVVPPLLPTAEQLSDRLCALCMFHPRRVRHVCPPHFAAPGVLAQMIVNVLAVCATSHAVLVQALQTCLVIFSRHKKPVINAWLMNN